MSTLFDSSHPLQSRSLDSYLQTRFGFECFRIGQREVIEAVLAGRDTLAVMPTGQGKSLCFQMPAALLQGLTVVISPLIALMKDQIDALRGKGIAAAAFHSGLAVSARDRVVQDLKLGRLRLLYLAPERLQHTWFIRTLRMAGTSRFVVDEAHCISHWGHDFRPDYMRLRHLRQELGDPPCVALTATATTQVQEDICEKLDLRLPVRVVTGFRRQNLQFSVTFCSSDLEKFHALERLLDQARAGSAIVYCATRRHVEEVAKKLTERRIGVGYYHAGLEDDRRAAVHDQFASGGIKVLVATNAFGMGIDKSDVRLVAHYDVPGSVEAYYQEAGRAGRDGHPASCALLFHHRDVGTQEFFIQQTQDGRQEELRNMLRQMVAYAYTRTCRQISLLEYFGDRDEMTLGPCGGCDRCTMLPSKEEEDPKLIAAVRTALAGVATLNGRFGIARMAELLAGSRSRALADAGLNRHAAFGTLRPWSGTSIARLLQRLVLSGYLRIEGLEYPVVTLTSAGAAILDGAALPRWEAPQVSGRLEEEHIQTRGEPNLNPGTPPVRAPDQDLLERLRHLRTVIAAEERIAAFLVFHDKTLHQLAVQRPDSPEALRSIHGIGPVKMERYGERLLKVLAERSLG
jgi:ATP-dependent DNA helicase RecQ